MKKTVSEIISSLYRGGYGGASEFCLKRIKSGIPTAVFTPNSEIMYRASRSKELCELLDSADLLFPDGIGSYIGMKLLKIPYDKRTSGIDLAEIILRECATCGHKVFLLGGKDGISARASKNLQSKYKGLIVCGNHHGYFENDKDVISKINSSGADILFVCLGFPKQEEWIRKNLKLLPSVKLAIGLGGSLDVWSGKVKRAPSIVSNVGLEWLWRILKDPKRLKRAGYLVNFFILLLKEAVFKPKNFSKCYEIDNFSK